MTHFVPLGEVAAINPDTHVRAGFDELCTFIPMSAVDEDSADIAVYATRPFREIAKGYVTFAEQDVLLAKITPCMENGKCAIARHLRDGIGFGSTEFHVVRASSKVLPEWIYFFWRFPRIRTIAERNMTGTAGQKRVPTTFLENLPIPLPPLEQQGRVVRLLGEADRLRRLRRYALKTCDEFLPAVFVQMFGDPRPEKTKWPTELLSDLGTLDRGRSKHRPRNAPHLYGGPYPFIQTGDVAQARRRILTHQQSYSEDGLKQSRLWPPGTLCITIAANIADTAVLTYPACFPDSVVGFSPGSRVTVEYIQFLLRFLQTTIRQNAPEVAQKNINLEILSELRCPVPPVEQQIKFQRLVHQHDQFRDINVETLRQADHLFQTLLHQAFSPQ